MFLYFFTIFGSIYYDKISKNNKHRENMKQEEEKIGWIAR